jgi:hypothetical protein
VGVEKRLVEDATSFAKEVTSLDEEGFISRTLAVLGIPLKDSGKVSENGEVTPEGRPHPAAGRGRGTASDLFVRKTECE